MAARFDVVNGLIVLLMMITRQRTPAFDLRFDPLVRLIYHLASNQIVLNLRVPIRKTASLGLTLILRKRTATSSINELLKTIGHDVSTPALRPYHQNFWILHRA